jgi:hypothetical protein
MQDIQMDEFEAKKDVTPLPELWEVKRKQLKELAFQNNNLNSKTTLTTSVCSSGGGGGGGRENASGGDTTSGDVSGNGATSPTSSSHDIKPLNENTLAESSAYISSKNSPKSKPPPPKKKITPTPSDKVTSRGMGASSFTTTCSSSATYVSTNNQVEDV